MYWLGYFSITSNTVFLERWPKIGPSFWYFAEIWTLYKNALTFGKIWMPYENHSCTHRNQFWAVSYLKMETFNSFQHQTAIIATFKNDFLAWFLTNFQESFSITAVCLVLAYIGRWRICITGALIVHRPTLSRPYSHTKIYYSILILPYSP